MDALITQADLELRIGARNLLKLTDEQHNATVTAALITRACAIATSVGVGLLMPGFEADAQVQLLVENDEGVKNAFVEIAIAWLGGRKPGMLAADGSTPFSNWRAPAEKMLAEIAAGKRRAAGEVLAGTNKAAIPMRVQPLAAGDTIFLATTDNPTGPGGF